jgi:phosphonate transport system substrate-binding protein
MSVKLEAEGLLIEIMRFKKFLLFGIIWAITGCGGTNPPPDRLSIGVVSYEEREDSLQRFDELKTYLGQQLKSLIELEPAYNEVKALQQIQRQNWDLVFAPPGLAALAISKYKYTAIFPLAGTLDNRSILVVLRNSSINQVRQLEGKTIALGQVGSATGYYLPLYNLYGLTLAQIRLAGSPLEVLSLVATKQVHAGAMSLQQFNDERPNFANVQFRVINSDSRPVPSGAVLLSPNLERRLSEDLQAILQQTPSSIAASAGFIPNADPPDYNYLIKVVERVNQISENVKGQPAYLHERQKQ